MFDLMARNRREPFELADLRVAKSFDRTRAICVIGERTYDRYRAHAAIEWPFLIAFRSQTIPSFISVIETIGRNLTNSENRPTNHAKLPIVIIISVIDGR